jgi:exodeoxyribonuclease VII large subunit
MSYLCAMPDGSPFVANIVEYTVSELAFALKRTIEDAYGWVRVRGELSGFKRAASGHMYFALKDEKAVLDAVCWRNTLPKLDFALGDGLEVICTGRLTTYPQRSRYQLVVERIEPAGAGALMALLEERRKRLAAEGLFAEARKRPIPFLPEVIGVVTSASGAVIRDILHRIEERFPRRVILWPVQVQGEGAAEQIAAAIRGFSSLPPQGPIPRPDVLIVARGGGSIEDLWAFNEEVVVRAAAASTIPLISAVGHETDTTLIDFAADRRAPTPTAAAEMVVPVRRELAERLTRLAERLDHAVRRHLDVLSRHVEGLARGLRDPATVLTLLAQRLDDASERLALRSPVQLIRERNERMERLHGRLAELLRDRLAREATQLRAAAARLRVEPILATLASHARTLVRENQRLDAAWRRVLETRAAALEAVSRQLESLSHRSVLERGYALVRRAGDGRVVPRLSALDGETRLEIEWYDGRLRVVRADGPAPGGRRRTAAAAKGQPSLF